MRLASNVIDTCFIMIIFDIAFIANASILSQYLAKLSKCGHLWRTTLLAYGSIKERALLCLSDTLTVIDYRLFLTIIWGIFINLLAKDMIKMNKLYHALN